MPSKLHIQLASTGKPLCGRQLVNHRSAREQTDAGRDFATNTEQFMTALGERKACRHCAREAGLIPRVTRTVRDEMDEGEGDSGED